MNVVVFGAGAIGSLYAAKLAPKHQVTIIARRAHVDAINGNGLRITGCEEIACRVRASTEIAAIEPDTLVLLTTKVNDNRAASAEIARRVRDDTIVLCVQNGLGSEEIVRAALGNRGLVLRAITQFGAIFREPGVIEYKVAGYTLIERHARSGSIANLLTASGLDGRVSENIKLEIWRKLIFNCVINPITSMIGGDVGSIANAGLAPLKRLVVDECVQVARADGVEFDIDFVRTIDEVFGPSRNIASMRQDLLRGKATEIDFLNAAVVALGRRHAIDCPVNAALVAIVKVMEARGRFVVP